MANGYIALSLGLLRNQESKEELRSIVERSSYRPDLLRQVSTGLGLLGDKNLAPLLAEQLGGSRSVAVQAAAANALGLIGDRRTIQPLVEMLDDEVLTSLGRAFAAAALGLVADRAPPALERGPAHRRELHRGGLDAERPDREGPAQFAVALAGRGLGAAGGIDLIRGSFQNDAKRAPTPSESGPASHSAELGEFQQRMPRGV